MGQTTKHGLRYPESTDLVKDTATYIKNLAEDTDTALTNQIIQESGSAETTNTYSASAMNNKIKTNIITDVESETNEYIDDKQVFVKRINFGTLPNATTETAEKVVSTGLNQNNVDIVKVDGIATGSVTSASYVLILPDINPMDYKQATRITMDTENDIWRVKIRVGVDRSNYTAYINIYYTKK